MEKIPDNLIIKVRDDQFAELVKKMELIGETIRICYRIGYDITYKTVKLVECTPLFLVAKELDTDGKKGTIVLKLAQIDGFRVV